MTDCTDKVLVLSQGITGYCCIISHSRISVLHNLKHTWWSAEFPCGQRLRSCKQAVLSTLAGLTALHWAIGYTHKVCFSIWFHSRQNTTDTAWPWSSKDFKRIKYSLNTRESRWKLWSLPLKILSDQLVPFTYKEDSPMTYASVIPEIRCRDWTSSCSISSPAASASTLSSTGEPPNSAMTASCILWLAAWKLPMEMVGKPCEVLALGCAFLRRLGWKRQMMIVERLYMFNRCLQDLTLTHLFWKGDITAAREGILVCWHTHGKINAATVMVSTNLIGISVY